MNSRRVVALTGLACLVALAGCGDPPAPVTTPTPGANPAPAPKPAQLSSQMVAAVSAGKTASAISVHFALEAPPTVATPLPVQIAIVPHRKFQSVQGYFESHDGLAMPSGGGFGPVKDVGPEKALTHQLVLLPGKEGMFIVTASIETMGEEGNVIRIFSIPVIVGPVQPAAPAQSEPPAPVQN